MPKIRREGGPSFDSVVVADATPPQETPDPGDEVAPLVMDVEAPRRNAGKTEWVKFASAKGVENAEQYSRDDLANWWYDQELG